MLTESVTKSLFRIRHSTSSDRPTDLRAVISQAFNDQGVTYCDARRLAYKPEMEAFIFKEPGGLLNRKLGIKRLDNLAHEWIINIEVLDGMPESISLAIALHEVEGLENLLDNKASLQSFNTHVADITNPHNVTGINGMQAPHF